MNTCPMKINSIVKLNLKSWVFQVEVHHRNILGGKSTLFRFPLVYLAKFQCDNNHRATTFPPSKFDVRSARLNIHLLSYCDVWNKWTHYEYDKGWGTNSESLGGSTEPFKEVHEIKTIFLIILFQSIDTCTDCAKEMVAKTTDTLVQIKTAVAPNKLVAIIPSLLYSHKKRGFGSVSLRKH